MPVDTETSEVIERINARIDALEVSLRAEFRAEIRRESASIREDIAEARRHAEVLHESSRDDIRMLADAFARMSVKLDSLER